jgi:hypothetical protein
LYVDDKLKILLSFETLPPLTLLPKVGASKRNRRGTIKLPSLIKEGLGVVSFEF